MTRGIILYGPPAAGKDTITNHLHALDPAYVLFPRLKAGPGRTTGYRMTTLEALDQLHRDRQVVWENRRYEARYAIDLPELNACLRKHVPVLHLGQPEAIDAVQATTPDTCWLVVSVWCPRNEAARRIEARATSDSKARLLAWDETQSLTEAHVSLNTAETPAAVAARTINEASRHQDR